MSLSNRVDFDFDGTKIFTSLDFREVCNKFACTYFIYHSPLNEVVFHLIFDCCNISISSLRILIQIFNGHFLNFFFCENLHGDFFVKNLSATYFFKKKSNKQPPLRQLQFTKVHIHIRYID